MKQTEVQKQNILLRQYINGLEQENQSRCRQTQILEQEVQNLRKQLQNSRLNENQQPSANFGNPRQLSNRNRQFNDSITQYKQQLMKCRQQVQRLQQEKLILLEGCKELDNLTQILQDRDEEISRKDEQLNELRYQNEQLRRNLSKKFGIQDRQNNQNRKYQNQDGYHYSSSLQIQSNHRIESQRQQRFEQEQRIQKEIEELHGILQQLSEQNKMLTERSQQLEQSLKNKQNLLNLKISQCNQVKKQLQSIKFTNKLQSSARSYSYSKEELQSSGDQLTRIRCQLQQLELQKDSLVNENRIIEEMVKNQGEQMQKYKRQIQSLKLEAQKQNDQFNKKIFQLKSQMQKKQKQQQLKLSKDLEDFKRTEIDAKRSQQNYQIKKFTNQITTLKEENSKMQKQKNKLQEKISEIQNSIANSTKDLNNRIKRLNHEKQELQKTVLAKDRQIKILKSDVNEMQAQLQQKNIILSKRAESLEELQKGIYQIDQQRKNQTEKLKSIIESKNEQLQNLTQAYNQKITAINNQYSLKKDALVQLQQTNNKLQMQLRQIVQQIEKYREQVQERQKIIRSMQVENKDLESVISNLKRQIKSHEVQAVGRLSLKSQNQKSIDNQSSASKANRKTVEDQTLRQVVNTLRKQLDEVKISNTRMQHQNFKMRQIIQGNFSHPSDEITYHTPFQIKTLRQTHAQKQKNVSDQFIQYFNRKGHKQKISDHENNFSKTSKSKDMSLLNPNVHQMDLFLNDFSQPKKPLTSMPRQDHFAKTQPFDGYQKFDIFDRDFEKSPASKSQARSANAQQYRKSDQEPLKMHSIVSEDIARQKAPKNMDIQEKINFLRKQNSQLKRILFQ